MGIHDANLVRREKIPAELFCVICHEFMDNPVQTKCFHLFCKSCITTAISTNGQCPNDRTRLSPPDVLDLKQANIIVYRIWSSCVVRCSFAASGCCWTGSPEKLDSHASSCEFSRSKDYRELKKAVKDLEWETSTLLARLEDSMVREADLKRGKRELEDLVSSNETAYSIKKQCLDSTIAQQQEKMVKLDTSYTYNRHTIVKLNRLIAFYLEGAPCEVDKSRIYQCILNINNDYKKKYSDNPPFMYQDLKMLLHTCLASAWFTSKQHSHLVQWISDMQ